MSTTDQAFIRAYGETVRSNRTAAAASRSPVASAEMIDGILSQSGGNWQSQQQLEVGLNQANWTVHPSSIDVDLNSTIPTPHFVHHRAAPVVVAPTAAPALGAKLPNRNRESALDRHQIALGRSTKAPLPAFTGSEFENTKHSVPKPAFEIDAVRWNVRRLSS